MASSRKRWMLTEDNLRRLQPSLIQPMPPVSISSDDDDDNNDGTKRKDISEDPAVDAVIAREAPAARVARLRTWVYNAMLTLVGLGDEGAAVLAVDELYIAGPGDVRLRPPPHKRRSTRLKENNRGGQGGNDGQHEEEGEDGDTPNLNDPAFWQAKLHYLEEKCRPLSQERRKRRRLAPESQIAAEDAARAEAEARAVEGRGPGCGYEYPAQMQQQQGTRPLVGPAPTPALPEVLTEEQRQAREEARAERERIEQSKLMWRDKRSRIQVWMETLPSPPSISSLSSSGSASNNGIPQIQVPPYGGLGGPAFDSRIHHYDQYGQQQKQQQQHPTAAHSDSSIVEITPAQFSNVQQQPQPPQEPTLMHQPATPHQQSQTFSTGHRHAGEGRPTLHSSPHMPHNMAHIMNAPGPEYPSGHTAHSHHHLPQQQQQQQQQYYHQHPQQHHSGAAAITHAMADASLDLSAVTPATAPHTAATPATLPIDTPITSASPGEGPVGDDMLAPSGAVAWPKPLKRDSHASLNASLNQSTSAVLGKRRRVGADGEIESGRA